MSFEAASAAARAHSLPGKAGMSKQFGLHASMSHHVCYRHSASADGVQERRHEGKGSLFAALKARGWASALSAGQGGGSFSARSFFSVHVDLTQEGAPMYRLGCRMSAGLAGSCVCTC